PVVAGQPRALVDAVEQILAHAAGVGSRATILSSDRNDRFRRWVTGSGLRTDAAPCRRGVALRSKRADRAGEQPPDRDGLDPQAKDQTSPGSKPLRFLKSGRTEKLPRSPFPPDQHLRHASCTASGEPEDRRGHARRRLPPAAA